MGKEELLNEIKRRSESNLQEKKEKALEKVKEIFRRSKKESAEEVKQLKEEGISEGIKELDRIISGRRMDVKREIMQDQEEKIQEVLEESKEKIKSKDLAEYQEDVGNLVVDGGSQLNGGKITVHGDKKSLNALKKLDLDEVSERIEEKCECDTSISIGDEIDKIGVIVEKGEVRVDNTFEARIDRAKDDLRVEISKILYGRQKGSNIKSSKKEQDKIKEKEKEKLQNKVKEVNEEEIKEEAKEEARKFINEEFNLEGWKDGDL